MRKTTNTGHFHEWASAASQLGVCLSVCVAVEWNGFPSPFSSLSDENRITRRWRTTASRWYLWCIHSLLAGLCASPWSFGLLFHADIAARVLPFVLSMRPPHFRQCTYPASLYPHVDALVVPTCKSSDPQNGQGKGRTVDGANTAPSTLCSGFMRPPSGLCSSSWCSLNSYSRRFSVWLVGPCFNAFGRPSRPDLKDVHDFDAPFVCELLIHRVDPRHIGADNFQRRFLAPLKFLDMSFALFRWRLGNVDCA